MSFHLVGPYLTTTNYKKRKNVKFKSAAHKAKYLAEKTAWESLLKKYDVDPIARSKRAIQNLKEVRKVRKLPLPLNREPPPAMEQKHGILPGVCAPPVPKVYTGTRLIGIATMHKSNMVPVFSIEDAKDISRMRR